MNEEYNISGKYPEDLELKYVLETVRDVKAGREGFVYDKRKLEITEKALKQNKIDYSIIENEDYWVIMGGGNNARRKNNKEKK